MSFIESRINDGLIVYETVGGPRYATDIVTTRSGTEQRNIRWSSSRGRWELGERRLRRSELDEIVAFFRAVKGKAYGFRFRDWSDYQATIDSGWLGSSGQGTGGPDYQMYKRYVLGSQIDLREIKKPVPGTVTVYRNSAPVAYGSSPGLVSLNTATGVVSFVADAQRTIQSITTGAATQITVAAAVGTLTAGQRLYVGAVSGSDAALLANQAHLINSVSGAGPVTYNLAVNTSGKTITPGGASVYQYPQDSDVLRWSGEFDVPVRFDTDELRSKFEAMASDGSEAIHYLYSLPVVEIRL